MSPLERLGKTVAALRRERGWTQADLAERSKLTRGYIARVEIGRHDPSFTTLVALARALRVPVADLFK